MVTDVRIKRTIRDYVAQNYKDQIIFVDYDKDGNPTKADDKAREIIGDPLPSNAMELLLEKTFDVSLFDRNEKERRGGSGKLVKTYRASTIWNRPKY